MSLCGAAASADESASSRHYVEDVLHKIVEENGPSSGANLQRETTGLFWNGMPHRTFLLEDVLKRPNFKASKDRATLLKCGDAAGLVLKPWLSYKSPNLRALKNKNKTFLPAYWMTNKKTWITKALVPQLLHPTGKASPRFKGDAF